MTKTTFQKEFIKHFGYPVETHHITTQDGYHLTLHRIPSNISEAKTILLVHPMTTSGIMWVAPLMTHPKPIAFALSDHGYDIWILHHRGTFESLNHETLKTSDKRYWHFTLHELAIYDVGSAVEYILDVTGAHKINYLSHSQGSSCFLILLSSKPEFNQKIASAYLLGPVGSFKHFPLSVQVLFGSKLTKLVLDFLESQEIYYLALSDARLYQIIESILSNKFQTNVFLSGLSLISGEFNHSLDLVSIILYLLQMRFVSMDPLTDCIDEICI